MDCSENSEDRYITWEVVMKVSFANPYGPFNHVSLLTGNQKVLTSICYSEKNGHKSDCWKAGSDDKMGSRP